MDILKIPFVSTTGIERNTNNALALPFHHKILNHIQTIHASAQFTLAETASGDAIQIAFPDLADNLLPLLRESTIKYKNPAAGTVTAFPVIAGEDAEKFREHFARKGRGLLAVTVELRDAEGKVSSISTFNWYLQRMDA